MKKVWVEHSWYGCDTGCCGGVIIVDDDWVSGSFEFMHLPEEMEERARKWAKDNGAEIDEEKLAEGVKTIKDCW